LRDVFFSEYDLDLPLRILRPRKKESEMNSNPISGLWLLLLIGLSVFAIVGAKGAKCKFINLLFILAFMIAGAAIGFVLGAWGGNMAIGGHVAAPLMILLGAVGAFGCIRRNKRRDKQAALPPAPTQNASKANVQAPLS
jgi:hypothetical protein